MALPCSGIARLPNLVGSLGSTDIERQDDPKVSPSSARCHKQELKLTCDGDFQALPVPRCPPSLEYIPIPGSWARKEHPHWNESVFQKPEEVREGQVYYFSKGKFIGLGSTAFVELLPSGHIIKTPKMSPYDLNAEWENRQSMLREASIYQLLGDCPTIPRFVGWDSEAYTLTLEYHPSGDLEHYIRQRRECPDSDCDDQVSLRSPRRKWAFQAAQALAAVHGAGVTHRDVAPRNYILTQELDLRICDFAGSSTMDNAVTEHAPGPGFQRQPWGPADVVTQADDIFGLGSVIYYIMTDEEPYQGLDNDEVDRRFWRQEFPRVDHLDGGSIIKGYWNDLFVTAEDVVSALTDG
ncbi:hypothetical protein VdG1_03630 [Verticillium dahliae VDG1]|nr:hypothetical protein VdG1_03630 [Verticillium dahliae VDG1]